MRNRLTLEQTGDPLILVDGDFGILLSFPLRRAALVVWEGALLPTQRKRPNRIT